MIEVGKLYKVKGNFLISVRENEIILILQNLISQNDIDSFRYVKFLHRNKIYSFGTYEPELYFEDL